MRSLVILRTIAQNIQAAQFEATRISANITDNYVSNLIHLAWLPPKMVESMLDGDAQATAVARDLMLKRDIGPIWKDVPQRQQQIDIAF